MKTPEELTALKAEVEALNKKLAELSEEELRQVTGATNDVNAPYCPFGCNKVLIFVGSDSWNELDRYICPDCGKLTHFWEGDRWVRGWWP